MKGYDLLKGMGHIDDDLVAEALEAEVAAAPEERKVVRLSRFAGWSAARRWGTAVAAVAVLCLAGLGAFGGMGQSSKDATPAAGAPMLGVTQEGEQKNTMNLGLTAEAAEEEDAAEMAEEPVEMAELDEAAPAETEPLPTEGVEMPTSDSYAYAGMDADAYNGKTLVSGYPDAPDGCYVTPKNGDVGYSEPLRAAMKEYGDEAVYRVWVDLFADEVQLVAGSLRPGAQHHYGPRDLHRCERRRPRLSHPARHLRTAAELCGRRSPRLDAVPVRRTREIS